MAAGSGAAAGGGPEPAGFDPDEPVGFFLPKSGISRVMTDAHSYSFQERCGVSHSLNSLLHGLSFNIKIRAQFTCDVLDKI